MTATPNTTDVAESAEVEWEVDSIPVRGTLLRPLGSGSFPAVVFVAGSSLLFQPDLTKIDLTKIDLANEREQERRNAAAGASFSAAGAPRPSRQLSPERTMPLSR